MSVAAKVLVVGPPGGRQGEFVHAISRLKVRASGREHPEGVMPMDFGQVRFGRDLDLQLFGVERDGVEVAIANLSPGIVGAVVLVDRTELAEVADAGSIIRALAERDIVSVVVATREVDAEEMRIFLGLGAATPVLGCPTLDRQAVKHAVVTLLESAVEAAEGPAA